MDTRNEILDGTISTPQQNKIGLPNAGGVLTLGILSIVFAGLLGLIMGIISLSLSGKALEEYRNNRDRYTESSYKNVNGGRICAIIGISISGLAILVLAIAFTA
jgi:hypothetical protein